MLRSHASPPARIELLCQTPFYDVYVPVDWRSAPKEPNHTRLRSTMASWWSDGLFVNKRAVRGNASKGTRYRTSQGRVLVVWATRNLNFFKRNVVKTDRGDNGVSAHAWPTPGLSPLESNVVTRPPSFLPWSHTSAGQRSIGTPPRSNGQLLEGSKRINESRISLQTGVNSTASNHVSSVSRPVVPFTGHYVQDY